MHGQDHELITALVCLQDFERERNPESVLQSMSLKKFARLIFQECPGLSPFSGSLDKIYKAFAEYKQVSGLHVACCRPSVAHAASTAMIARAVRGHCQCTLPNIVMLCLEL